MTVNPDLSSMTLATRALFELYLDDELFKPAEYTEAAEALRKLASEIDETGERARKKAT